MSEIHPEIRYLVENYYDIQKLRTASFNRVVAYVKSQQISSAAVKPSVIAHKIVKGDVEVPKEISNVVWFYNSLLNTEKQLAKRMDVASENHSLRVQYLNKILGIGPVFSSGLIAWLSPISRFSNISQLWAYCGLSAQHWQCECKEGHRFLITRSVTSCPIRVGKKREPCAAEIVKSKQIPQPIRRKRGYVMLINGRLKTFMWKIAASFEKQDSEESRFRGIYLPQKVIYLSRPSLAEAIKKGVKGAKLHVRFMAMRYTVKRFLAEVWVVWRVIEGLPVTKPFVHDRAGHSHYELPEVDKSDEEWSILVQKIEEAVQKATPFLRGQGVCEPRQK
ncbi:MAG: transposase [Candidatus Bathyarchaeota archaeon]|nr:transposase [Candidatus Bathyarchaeota archaeon]